jgi:hypothetical protein
MHHQLGRRGLDGVGVLQLPVPDELALVVVHHQMRNPGPPPALECEAPLLGDCLHPVDPGGLAQQAEHLVGLCGVELVERLDGGAGFAARLGSVSRRHAVERTGERGRGAGPPGCPACSGFAHCRKAPEGSGTANGNHLVTAHPLLRYARRP